MWRSRPTPASTAPRIGETRIARGAKIDNLVQVGHGSTVGENTLLCAQVGLAGSATIGKNVILAGQVGVAGHITVGDGAIATAQTGITKRRGRGQVHQRQPVRRNARVAALGGRLQPPAGAFAACAGAGERPDQVTRWYSQPMSRTFLSLPRAAVLAFAPLLSLVMAGCHSAYIDATVKNVGAEPVSLIEVDYPSASFGRETLAAGAEYHYRFKVLGSGATKVLWTDAAHTEHTTPGPVLHEGDEGS